MVVSTNPDATVASTSRLFSEEKKLDTSDGTAPPPRITTGSINPALGLEDEVCAFACCVKHIDERCISCGERYCGNHLVVLEDKMIGHRANGGKFFIMNYTYLLLHIS